MKTNRLVRTLTGGGGSAEQVAERHPHLNPCEWTKSRAFTMAEILLSLTIIGVVAAITLPSLTGNINERTWNTQRKALYARMSQAIALMPAVNGYGKVSEDADQNVTEDTAAETFVTEGLSKVLKINNICDSEHLADCGIASTYTNINGSKMSMPENLHGLNSFFNLRFQEVDGAGSHVGPVKSCHLPNTKAAAFETQNGESILTFYNPSCQSDIYNGELSTYAQTKMCANFIFDLNGSKGPNTVGKDIGAMSVIYPSDSVVVAPVPLYAIDGTYTQQEASKVCNSKDNESRIPNIEEFMSLAYNLQFTGIGNKHYWSSTLTSPSTARVFHLGFGRIYSWSRSSKCAVLCVKR